MTFEPDKLRILSNTQLSTLRYLPAVGSTNDAAKSLGVIKLPAMLIAGEQTSGRGQQTNIWWSDPNSLTCSWIAQSDKALPDNLTALAAAIATANAIEQTAPGLEPKAKWPNDIFINNAKVAGILVESDVRKDSTRIIVGIGINSNCDLKNAPDTIQQRSTSLLDVLNQEIDQNHLIIALANQLESQVQCLKENPGSIVERFNTLSLLRVGMTIKLLTRDGVSHGGIFKGIGSHGELILEKNANDRIFFSATIAEYSP